MTTVVANDEALRRFFGITGPVGRDMRRRGEKVRALGVINASGPVLGIKTHRLLDYLGPPIVFQDEQGAAAVRIGTTATKEGFSYPAFHDTAGAGLPHGGQRPWLTQALREGFDA